MFKKVGQRGRSERWTEAYSVRYVEVLSEARTKLTAFFNILPSKLALKDGILPSSESERQGGVNDASGLTNTKGSG